MASDWTMLPLEVLHTIALKLKTFEDFLSFTLVCRCWNRVSSIKSDWSRALSVPCLLLAENTLKNPYFGRKIFNLSNNKRYRLNLPETFGKRCWGTPYGWFAMVDRSLNVQLFNPITKAKIHFPSLKTFPGRPDYDKKKYTRRKSKSFHTCLQRRNLFVLKVAQSGQDEFVIMNIHGCWTLGFARPRDESWTRIVVKQPPARRFANVASVDDNIFVIYDDGTIDYWNIKEFQNREVIKPMDYLGPKPEIFGSVTGAGVAKLYLVQASSTLLAVLRHKEEVGNETGDDLNFDIVYRTIDFDVYRLDHKDKSWEEIEDLGNAALFVGANSSMCVSTSKNGLQSNCIYFTDDESDFWDLPKKLGGHDMGVFDIKSGQIHQFYKSIDTRSAFCPPTFFIPQF